MFEPKRRCNQCGEMRYSISFSNGKCEDCKKIAQKSYDRDSYKRHRMRNLLRNAKTRANRKGRQFDLDLHVEELQARLDKGFCEATGLPFNLDNDEAFAWDSPSLDRIDSNLGYEYDNIRIVLYGFNAAVGRWGEDAFRVIAEAYLERN